MSYYKLIYNLGANNAYIYPSSVRGVVWTLAQYHYTERVMVGKTEHPVAADGVEVIELSEADALTLIEEFKQSYPKVSEKDMPFPPVGGQPRSPRGKRAEKRSRKK